jgi:hypothetical protein
VCVFALDDLDLLHGGLAGALGGGRMNRHVKLRD